MRKNILTAFLLTACISMNAQTIEFYTPNTVRVVKENGKSAQKKSLVVIAKPEGVKVNQSQKGAATIYKSSALTVTVEGGKVSFAD